MKVQSMQVHQVDNRYTHDVGADEGRDQERDDDQLHHVEDLFGDSLFGMCRDGLAVSTLSGEMGPSISPALPFITSVKRGSHRKCQQEIEETEPLFLPLSFPRSVSLSPYVNL